MRRINALLLALTFVCTANAQAPSVTCTVVQRPADPNAIPPVPLGYTVTVSFTAPPGWSARKATIDLDKWDGMKWNTSQTSLKINPANPTSTTFTGETVGASYRAVASVEFDTGGGGRTTVYASLPWPAWFW